MTEIRARAADPSQSDLRELDQRSSEHEPGSARAGEPLISPAFVRSFLSALLPRGGERLPVIVAWAIDIVVRLKGSGMGVIDRIVAPPERRLLETAHFIVYRDE